MERPKVLQVITDTDRRGAQIFAMDLGSALEPRGWKVRNVALTTGMVGGLEVPALGPRRLAPSTLTALRSTARNFDVVVAHGSTTLFASALAGIAGGTPFVYRQVSDSLFWASSAARRLRVRLGLRRAAAIVSLWAGAAETLRSRFGVAEERIHVIPNGVPPMRCTTSDRADARVAASWRLDPHRLTLLYVGALVPEKGVNVAISAMEELVDVQLLIVGDGPERTYLEELAAKIAPDRVFFTGALADPAIALGAADVLVLPSRGGDSMPAVLIEAAMAGLPSIATAVQAIPEVVVDGVTGYLVPIGSSAALAAAVRRVRTGVPTMQELGANARVHALAYFSIDRVAQQWSDLLLDIAGRELARVV